MAWCSVHFSQTTMPDRGARAVAVESQFGVGVFVGVKVGDGVKVGVFVGRVPAVPVLDQIVKTLLLYVLRLNIRF